MAVTWITPVAGASGATGSWVDIDNAAVPDNATGVILHFRNTADAEQVYGFRKNGSTDDRTGTLYFENHGWGIVGCDSSGIFELYRSSTQFIFDICGYFTDDAVFNTNGVDKSLGSTSAWTDIDISSDTGADTAIGAIVEIFPVADGSYNWGLRKNGSSDNRTASSTKRSVFSGIVGVDGSEIFEGYISNTGMDFYLLGYVTTESTFHTNATDLSLGTTAAWTDLTAIDTGATGGFIEIHNGNGNQVGLRKNGSSENIYRKHRGHTYGHVECDASQLIEGEISNTATDFFLVGFTEEAAGGGDPANPLPILTIGVG